MAHPSTLNKLNQQLIADNFSKALGGKPAVYQTDRAIYAFDNAEAARTMTNQLMVYNFTVQYKKGVKSSLYYVEHRYIKG